MTLRKQLLDVLVREARSVSSLAREIGLPRSDVEDALQHMIRSARDAGHRVVVVPARCRSCGFTFDDDRLTRPSKCPKCRNSRIFEPQIGVDTTPGGT